MSIKIIKDLSDVIKDEEHNNYSNFKAINNEYGVYIFQNKNSNEILYIGQAKKQTLKERIIQNFKQKDNGGTFRKNYIKKENSNFSSFKDLIKSSEVIVIACPQNIIITALEAILINILKPKYNIEI